MQLVVLGLNHRSAAVEVRERFSFEKNEVESALNRLYEYEKNFRMRHSIDLQSYGNLCRIRRCTIS